MGLDISVNVTAEDAILNMDECENALHKSEALRILSHMDPIEKINTRTGSYAGLHALRQEYAKLKGWEVEPFPIPITDQNRQSHLINHSDCEGWYIPDKFEDPQWILVPYMDSISIGSSVRLVDELTELLTVKDKWPGNFQWRWDALFVAAIVSVVTWQPVKFH